MVRKDSICHFLFSTVNVFLFYSTVSTSIEDGQIRAFVQERVQYPGTEIVSQSIDRDGDVPRLNVVLLGEYVCSE